MNFNKRVQLKYNTNMNKRKEVRNMKDEEKLLKAIHENHKKVQREKQIEKANKKRQGKEKLIVIALIVIAVVGMILNGVITDKAINQCVEEGFSKGYCVSKLS